VGYLDILATGLAPYASAAVPQKLARVLSARYVTCESK